MSIKQTKKYRANPQNEVKIKARRVVFVELRAGRLVKKPCFCGNPKSEAHHADYSKPLDIRWMCRRHHRQMELGLTSIEADGSFLKVVPE